MVHRTQKRVKDLRRGERGSQGEVPTSQPLGDSEQVWQDFLMLTGKHLSGPTESGGHFIGDEENFVGPTQLPDPSHKARRIGQDPCCPLDQWFHDEARHLVMVDLNHPLHFFQGCLLFCQDVRGRQGGGFKKQGLIQGVKEIDAPHTHGTQGIPMIGSREV